MIVYPKITIGFLYIRIMLDFWDKSNFIELKSRDDVCNKNLSE